MLRVVHLKLMPGTAGCYSLPIPFSDVVIEWVTCVRLQRVSNSTSRQTRVFRQFLDVLSPPCLPDVRYRVGCSMCSGHPCALLTTNGKRSWAMAGRRQALVSQNVARHRNHRALATHPKLTLMMFPVLCTTSAVLGHRRCDHAYVRSMFESGLLVFLCNLSNEPYPRLCFLWLRWVTPHLFLLFETDRIQ